MELLAKMKLSDWLHIFGALLIAVSIVSALMSNHYNSMVMGEANLGFGRLAPERGTEMWNEQVRLRNWSNRFFYSGIILAAFGLIAQVSGLMLSVSERLLPPQ